jgi:Flp pilus assembly protein TadG
MAVSDQTECGDPMKRQGSIERQPAGLASGGLLGRLARDRSGNTMILVAASLAPLLALIGGGIDMSRGYLSQVRLQQACDSGVLAARKKLGTAIVTDGVVPDAVADVGNRFFDLNFADGAYGSEDLNFSMALEEDYAISGEATVVVPTTVMAIFGNEQMDVTVKCEARINYSDTDIMFVLDTTGSMNSTNPGDSMTRIEALRETVSDFHTQIEESKSPGTRVRYGFVPYAVNVNVGHLLEDDWVVDEWTYQSRTRVDVGTEEYQQVDWINWVTISGTYSDSTVSTYAATWHPPTTTTTGTGESAVTTTNPGYYSCNGAVPSNTSTYNDTLLSETNVAYAGPPVGTKNTKHYRRVVNGNEHWNSLSGSTCSVMRRTYNTYTQEFDRVEYPAQYTRQTWRYQPVTKDVTNWRSETAGCMEERDTYEIYSMDETIDFSRALDLDLDTVPTAGNPSTQWRPMYPDIIWARALTNSNPNNFKVEPQDYDWDYFKPARIPALVACPTGALRLDEMTGAEVSTYLSSLVVSGQTYHDIGMIWGGRLISPTGLYADENAPRAGKSLTRHLIFLTDGITQPRDISYTSYGLEPLDQRRWTERPDPLLDRTIELRFGIACDEVKKRNVTVWVIGFGTEMNDIMKDCAGEGRWFQADDAEELAETFELIAKSMAELRVSK